MEVLKTFRHEYKYLISYHEMLALRSKLNELLPIDRNYNGYVIRSLYFDSVDENDYYDKLDGVINRKKIRLRIYDSKGEIVKLELKSKYDIHQLKESLIISKDDAIKLINEEYEILLQYNNEVAKKIYTMLRRGSYKPKTIIEYNRIAYKTTTTTRITLDYDIKCSTEFDKFFSDDINFHHLTNRKEVVLEVKFDRFLEPYISNVLTNYQSKAQSVSKYIMGRNL